MAASREMAALIAADDELLNRRFLPHDWPHEAPDRAFSVEGAHYAMQRHMSCPIDSCARKRAAHAVLVEAGHIVPDPRNSRNLG
ncbi:hypothetical protein [Nocardia cyriacigeorgica]|uniref:hypothetical protein n=1 Tax=Nocardia cyriacigeorgica TaxID=135487 RepID=UPI00245786CF|nr:hypothetical protein [Nocardia cyriacigeorgica]